MKTKQQLHDELGLDELPDDEFMHLLAEVGDAPIVQSSRSAPDGKCYTPEDIQLELTSALVATTVGDLLARARADANMSLRKAGTKAGLSHTRIQQVETSENPEVATLLRVANALGYGVQIDLIPKREGLHPISAALHTLGA